MNNKTKKTSTILFGTLIAAMMLPFSMMDIAEAKIDHLSGLNEDVKNIASDKKQSQKDYQTIKEELKQKYKANIDKFLKTVEEKTQKKIPTNAIPGVHDYVVSEALKRAVIDQAYTEEKSSPSKYATNKYPISKFYQPRDDVYGGYGDAGGWYIVNGGNQLIGVDKIVSSYQSMTRYVLEWKDEDHPNPTLDAIYDQIRLEQYGRIADVETFIVKNGVIEFDYIWDEDKKYGDFFGAHGDKDRTYKNGVKIYANTWNHALDIYDNNRGMSKYIKYF